MPQIRWGFENNTKLLFFYFSRKNISYDPSLELSQQDGPNNGSHCMFLRKNKKKISINHSSYPFLSRPMAFIFKDPHFILLRMD